MTDPREAPPLEPLTVPHLGGTLQATRQGTGTPPVVLITGLGLPARSWREVPDDAMLRAVMATYPWNDRPLVEPALAQWTRVISYDRAGSGDSSPPTQVRGLSDFLGELGAVLRAAEVSGPAVLVGHSLGGLVAYEYARRFPDQVAGLVLIDSSHPDQSSRLAVMLSAEQQQADHDFQKRLAERLPERPDLNALLRQGQGTVQAGALGDLPLAVVSRGVPMPFERASLAVPGLTRTQWQQQAEVASELQAEYLAASGQAQHFHSSRSGHYVQFDDPELVIEAVQRVWTLAGGTSGPA